VRLTAGFPAAAAAEVGGEVYGKVKAATSIVMSGCYEDDHDAATDIVKYTGEGPPEWCCGAICKGPSSTVPCMALWVLHNNLVLAHPRLQTCRQLSAHDLSLLTLLHLSAQLFCCVLPAGEGGNDLLGKKKQVRGATSSYTL
jgi:hypothetical protein